LYRNFPDRLLVDKKNITGRYQMQWPGNPRRELAKQLNLDLISAA
jgi:hypothetical protein